MALGLTISQAILPLIAKHSIIISFLGGFLTGETVIISLAFLSATGVLPILYVLVFSMLGMYFSDFIPFTVGRHRWFVKFFWEKKVEHRGKNIERILNRYTRHNLFLILLFTKFVYGASIPALLYLGSKKTPYARFCLANFLVEIIFVPVVCLVGWAAGKGFTIATNIFADIRIALFLLIALIVIFVLVRRWIDRRLTQEQRQ